MNNKVLTKSGFIKAQDKLKKLNEERKRLVAELDGARDDGDWSENSALESLTNQVQVLENQIIETEQLLESAKVVSPSTNGQGIGLGSKVRLRANGSEKALEIVSDGQADPLKGQISPSSPLAQSLIGKKAGEQVAVSTPSGKVIYNILSIGN
ncbi:MAG: GreA/GreB family elongation factor [Candidatus Shapirobacteria bacterium]